jgi:DNA-binding beta-propeller fold protein YncE
MVLSAGDARVAFQYIYSPDTAIRGTHPYGDSITIPEGTKAKVSHYNLYSYFKYYPDPPVGETFIEARVGVFADSAAKNSGKLFIDNFRLDVVSPADDYTRFEDHDTLKEWSLISGNGVRKVYGQFSDGAGNETAVSFDSIIVDTTKPARRISYPQNGQTISDTITITGWAHDSLDDPPHFKQYELQHQAQMSANWYGNDPDSISYTPKYPIQVGQGQKPVELGDWNTYQVNDGWYNLKLTVADSASNSRDTTISVNVNNEGDGEGGFSGFSNYVYGLAAGNQVYIGEFNTGKIYQYNTNYELIDTFKLVDSVGTGFPLAMAMDDSGKLWVANTNSHLISKFTSQGSLLLRFAGGFSMPSGFAFDNSGNIWVSDRLHHKIKKFNQDGDSLFAFGTQGSEPGEIDRPIGIAFFDNRIYIADSKNKRVSVFDTLGNFIEVIADSAGIQMPFGLVIDSSGCIFVSDFFGNQVIEFDPYGNQLYKIDSILDSPTGLALSPDANILYVSDTRNKRVLAFQVRGEPPDSGGGPQAYGDSYFDRLMFDVYPSLSAKQMNIRLQGFAGMKISLKVYDVTGRLIKTFYDNQMIKANQSISWDCKDDINRKLANGVYFIRLETEDYKETKKVILLE